MWMAEVPFIQEPAAQANPETHEAAEGLEIQGQSTVTGSREQKIVLHSEGGVSLEGLVLKESGIYPSL